MTNLTLYHVANTRSVRPLILYHELKSIYGQRIPELMVHLIPKEQLRAPNKAAILYELNPNAKVPVLQHGETVIFEGCAICLYFLKMFDEDHILAPENQDFRAILYQFSVYTPGTLDNLTAHSSPIQKVYGDNNPMPNTDPDAVARNKEAWLQIAAPFLVSTLANRGFMYGDKFTALDVIVGFFLIGVQFKRPDWIIPFATLNDYVNRLKLRPMFQKTFQTA